MKKWFLKKSVGSKLSVALGSLVLLLFVSTITISGANYWAMSNQSESGANSQGLIFKVANLDEAVLLARVHLRDYFIFASTNDQESANNSKKRFEKYAAKIKEAKLSYLEFVNEKDINSGEVKVASDELITNFEIFTAVALNIYKEIGEGNFADAAYHIGADCHRTAGELLASISKIKDIGITRFENNISVTENIEILLAIVSLFLLALAIILYKLMSSLVRSSIVRPLGDLSEAANQLANDKEIYLQPLASSDELADLVIDFNLMSKSLTEEKERVKEANEKNLSVQADLASQTEQKRLELKNGADDILNHLENIVKGDLSLGKKFKEEDAQEDHDNQDDIIQKMLGTLVQAISSIGSSLSHVSHSTSDNIDKAKKGAETIMEVSNATMQVVEYAEDMSSSIDNLQKVKEDITNIIGVINKIAEQTNLLALNASIEAARAGEQGRGFAVVADEVRMLASKTVDATQQIDDLIARLNEETENSVKHVNLVNEKISESNTLAKGANDALNEIVNTSGKIESALNVFHGY